MSIDWNVCAVCGKFVELVLQLLGQRATAVDGVSSRVTQYSFKYLEMCVSYAKQYQVMKPHLLGLLQDCIFPVCCFGHTDQELWNDDPHEYIRKSTDPEEELTSPQAAAVNLLIQLSKQRGGKSEKKKGKKAEASLLDQFMQFLLGVMVEYRSNPTIENAFRKEGALYAMGSISEKIMSVVSQQSTDIVCTDARCRVCAEGLYPSNRDNYDRARTTRTCVSAWFLESEGLLVRDAGHKSEC